MSIIHIIIHFKVVIVNEVMCFEITRKQFYFTMQGFGSQ